MSIFRKIMTKIFGSARANTDAQPTGEQQQQSTPQPDMAPRQQNAGVGATQAPVDVEAILSDMAAKNSQRLNWRESIVDLMKLLNLDSSLKERQELARELGYTGDMNDSATMNIWLHKQVMQGLARNGGKVPPQFLN